MFLEIDPFLKYRVIINLKSLLQLVLLHLELHQMFTFSFLIFTTESMCKCSCRRYIAKFPTYNYVDLHTTDSLIATQFPYNYNKLTIMYSY